jgi:hypothetical protein
MEFELMERERCEFIAREEGFKLLALFENYDHSPFDAGP